MTLVLPDIGERAILDAAFSDASPNAQSLRLYTAISPALGENTVAADFTEATFTGYAAKPLVRATWSAANTVGGTTTKSYPIQTWLPTTSETVIGYYVTEAVALDLWFAETFASPRSVNNGDTLTETINFQLA